SKQATNHFSVLFYCLKIITKELDNQVPLVDEIDTKVDKATSDIKNTNVRLKQTLNQCFR
ncbi:hypothetical protein F8388_012637, partial [Cannabis sativa]